MQMIFTSKSRGDEIAVLEKRIKLAVLKVERVFCKFRPKIAGFFYVFFYTVLLHPFLRMQRLLTLRLLIRISTTETMNQFLAGIDEKLLGTFVYLGSEIVKKRILTFV